MVELGATTTPMCVDALCTTGSGPTIRSRSPRCTTTPTAIGNVLPAAAYRAQIKAARPILGRDLGQGRDLPASGFMTRTSAMVTATSRSSLSSISSARVPIRPDHDLARSRQGDDVAVVEQRCRLRLDDRSARRTRWMNSRCSGTRASASALSIRTSGDPSGKRIGPQLELPPGGRQAGLGAAHSQGLLQPQRLLSEVDLREGPARPP